jgi:hypothetical protein
MGGNLKLQRSAKALFLLIHIQEKVKATMGLHIAGVCAA